MKVLLANTSESPSRQISHETSQGLPLSSDVKHINTNAVAALATDVSFLTDFVDSLENGAMLRENLDELQQTVNLLQSDNHDEFFDISIRNKKFGRVNAMNGPILLEKSGLDSLLSPIFDEPGNADLLPDLLRRRRNRVAQRPCLTSRPGSG